MTAVVIALLPAAGFGIYNFGPRALAVMAVTSSTQFRPVRQRCGRRK